MLKDFYNVLSTHLRDNVDGLKQIAPFASQYTRTDRELPVLCPALFIQFADIPWKMTGLHTREAKAELVFHLVIDYMLENMKGSSNYSQTKYGTMVFDQVQAVEKALQGWQAKRSNIILSSEMVSVRTEQDATPDGLQIWLLTFTCELIDNSTNRDRNMEPYQIPTLHVQKPTDD